MKDEDKTKAELIKEFKTLKKEREKSAINDVTERKQVERREKKLITEMDFLYKTALNFVQLESKDDVYQFIGKRLKKIAGDSIVLVNSYDKASDSFRVRALEGVREKTKKVLKIIGKDLFTMSFPINNEEMRNTLISSELLKIPGSFYELTSGQIPKSICHVLEKFLNVGEIYSSGFSREKELFGNIIIIMPKGTELNNREFINTFIKQAAIALQKKQAEEELKDSEERLKILFDYAPDAYYINDLKGKFIDGNKAAERVIGYKREELIGKSFLELKLLSLADISKAVKLLAKNLIRLPTGPDEFVLNRKDNSKITVEISTYPVKIKEKTLVLGIARDITEYKEAGKALAESEERYHIVFENTGTATMIIEEDRTISMVNTQGEKLSGYSKEEIENKMKWTDFIVPEDLERMKKYHIARRKAGEKPPTEYEFRMTDKKGNVKDMFLKIGMIPNTKKSIASLTDITERKQAEENVKNAKDELQMIMDSVPAIIFYKDTEGRIIRANKTLANSLKMPVKDIVGKTTEELFPKEQAENMRKDDKEVIISGKPKRNIIEPYDTPEGTRWAITDKMTYRDKKGKITGVIDLSKDITLQRKSEEELQQSYQKLKKTMDAAIDTMSRIIEAKDPYTSGHQHRVCQLAVPLARELGLPEDKIEGIRIASLIHDIGKIGLPAEILSKPTKLTDIEFSLIKGHSQIGYNILKSIDFSYPIAQIVLQHHERLNGSGYPNNLKGDEIILEAKIIGVADVVEAISSFRPYRPALGTDKALEEITQNRGILYDPEVVDMCLKLFKEKGFKF